MKSVVPIIAAQTTTTTVAIMRTVEDEAPAVSGFPKYCTPMDEPGATTVKYDAAYLPRASEADRLYMPAETEGMVNVDAMFPELSAFVPATYVAPKFTLTVTPGLNPDPVMLTEVPDVPIEELNVIEAVVWVRVPEGFEVDGFEEEPFWVTVNIFVARFPYVSVAVTG